MLHRNLRNPRKFRHLELVERMHQPQYRKSSFSSLMFRASSLIAHHSGVSANYVSVNSITPLQEAVSVGGSIVIKSSFIKLDIPRGNADTGIALLYLDASTGDASDEESFDVLLGMLIKSKLRVLDCNSKQARHGYAGFKELKPETWFQKDDPKIRIDVGADEFMVYVNGRKVGAVNRMIRRDKVTHVRYWTRPPRAEPVMAKEITVTAYKQTSLVP